MICCLYPLTRYCQSDAHYLLLTYCASVSRKEEFNCPADCHPARSPSRRIVRPAPRARAVEGLGGRSTASWTPREILLLIGLCVSVALNCLVAAVLLTEPSPQYLIAPPASPPPFMQSTKFDSLHNVLDTLGMSEYAPNLVNAGVSTPKHAHASDPIPLRSCVVAA